MRQRSRIVPWLWPWWPVTVALMLAAIVAGSWGISDRDAPRPLIWAAIIAMLVWSAAICPILDCIRTRDRR